ncbi:MAG: hypothetical protein H6818_23885 [Phycisphaerales bacterium]|nr:hypothetical protein [Phycisphaerales bacterium]
MSDKAKKPPGGLVHTYRGYDPKRFPMPADAPADLVTPAFNHLLAYGNLDDLTPEQLAEAIEIDPSQIKGLGPSIQSLLAMLEERKRRILETYETSSARRAADQAFLEASRIGEPPAFAKAAFEKAVRDEHLADLERLWYRLDGRHEFATSLVGMMERLAEKFEIEQLASKYEFTGRREMDVPQAMEIKEELERIDRLIEQLREAAKNAKIYLIDMNALSQFASAEQMEGMEEIQRQVAEALRQLAEQQGLQQKGGRITLTPKAFRLFQSKLLDQIFGDIQAARTGRHDAEVVGDGAVETQRTRSYEFGDSLANMDVTATVINAMIRERAKTPDPSTTAKAGRVRILPEDIEVHITRNTPKCATAVCMDMSGSMRYNGQYINVKRMALALHGLIRSEYPGDFVDFVEVCSLPRRVHISEVPELLPKPVTIFDPVVRLKADMSDERITSMDIPPHFTNIQRGLSVARQMLQVQDTPNRQIILITDGLPTAHFEGSWLYLLYPPHARTEQHTLREGLMCREQGITINIFLLSSWGQTEEDVHFAQNLAESTSGRVIFVGGRELDRYVVWDYVKRRRVILG